MLELPGCTVNPRKTIPNGPLVIPVFLTAQCAPPSVLLKTPNEPGSPLVPAHTMFGSFGSTVRLKMVYASPLGPPRTVIPVLAECHELPRSTLLLTPA